MNWILQIIAAILTLLFLVGMIGSAIVIVVTAIEDLALFVESDEPKAERRALPTSQQRREERRKAIRIASAPPSKSQRIRREFQRMLEFLHLHASRHRQQSH